MFQVSWSEPVSHCWDALASWRARPPQGLFQQSSCFALGLSRPLLLEVNGGTRQGRDQQAEPLYLATSSWNLLDTYRWGEGLPRFTAPQLLLPGPRSLCLKTVAACLHVTASGIFLRTCFVLLTQRAQRHLHQEGSTRRDELCLTRPGARMRAGAASLDFFPHETFVSPYQGSLCPFSPARGEGLLQWGPEGRLCPR